MAAVLSCGDDALLSDDSAGSLYAIRASQRVKVDITIIRETRLRRSGVDVHRRSMLRPEDRSVFDGIPVTSPVRTPMDLATRIPPRGLEAAVNAADSLGLVDAETLRGEVGARRGEPGSPALVQLLDGGTFRLTESELERLFLPLARRAGLPTPDTQVVLDAFRVDFHLERDQAHQVAGLRPLRFSHLQIRYRPEVVVERLRVVAAQQRATAG